MAHYEMINAVDGGIVIQLHGGTTIGPFHSRKEALDALSPYVFEGARQMDELLASYGTPPRSTVLPPPPAEQDEARDTLRTGEEPDKARR